MSFLYYFLIYVKTVSASECLICVPKRGLAGNILGDKLKELFGAGTGKFFLCAGVRRICTVG